MGQLTQKLLNGNRDMKESYDDHVKGKTEDEKEDIINKYYKKLIIQEDWIDKFNIFADWAQRSHGFWVL